jgi:hypothetical protein
MPLSKEEKELIQAETFTLDKRRLHKTLFDAMVKSKRNYRIQLPFFSDPHFRPEKRGLATFHITAIDCIKHCVFAKKCPYWYKRPVKEGKHTPCWNFMGKELNLQICSKCGSVRIVEYPKRIKGTCQKCRGQSEGIENPDPKFIDNPVSEDIYLTIKKMRLEELQSE